MPVDAAASSPSVPDLQRRIEVLESELRALAAERDQATTRQAAAGEVLQVIHSSSGELRPVFDAMLESATRLCDAAFGILWLCDGERFHAAALHGVPEGYAEIARIPVRPSPNNPLGRMLRGERVIVSVDAAADELYRTGDAVRRALVDVGGARSYIQVALVKDTLLGSLTVYRTEARPFSDGQVSLLESFAAHAVTAIDNARLLTEQREALAQQTATAEVLQVINSSPGDLGPVFDIILEKAHALCGVAYGSLQLYDGEKFRAVAVHSLPEPLAQWLREGYVPGPKFRRLIDGEDFAHFADMAAIDDPMAEAVTPAGIRSLLTVALRKDGRLLGQIVAARNEVRPFSDEEIALLLGFAAQAVIAMENARLLGELRESLDQQTATAGILRVISQSPTDVQPVLDAVVRAAVQFCGAEDASITLRAGDELLGVSHAGPLADQFGVRMPINSETASGLATIEGRVVHIPDVATLDPVSFGRMLEFARHQGFAAVLAAPMLREGRAIGTVVLRKGRAGAFTPRQIDLLQSFAAQAVIALENTRLFTELRESLDHQTATSDVLSTISRSSSVDLPTVLNTLVETVARLCRADQAYMFRHQEGLHHLVASHGASEETKEYILANPFRPDRGNTSGRVLLERRTIHIPDVLTDPDYTYSEGQKIAGFRTMLGIPLMREGSILGVFVVSRTRVNPFSDKQIALATGFADQAVIAIENARLFEELRDRQAELRVTFDNMGDAVCMFDADFKLASWNKNFRQLLDIPDSFITSRPAYDDYVRLLVGRGELGDGDAETQVAYYRERVGEQWSTERTRPDGRVIEVRHNPVPDGGIVLIYSDITERKKAEAEISAARDAAEAALERQTATADILKVIASSPTDVQPVLEAVAKAAVRFCGAGDALVSVRDGEFWKPVAHVGPMTGIEGERFPLTRQSVVGRAIIDARTTHVPDVSKLDPQDWTVALELSYRLGFSSALAAPMLHEGKAIGVISLRRPETGEFSTSQVSLLETFAAQAVIAIQNVRLFTELREALEQQTATSEILRVISQSPTDVNPVLSAVAKAALKFCGAYDAIVVLRDGDSWFTAAHEGHIETPSRATHPLTRRTAPGRAILDGNVVQIADYLSDEANEFSEGREISIRYGFRSVLAAPLLRDDAAIGAISLRRAEPGTYTPNQIELLKSFAAQAVIAIENVRLFTELRDSLERLKAAQANLIQAEKMASLGQLTAGIAHEIKNPLNFINNFAGLSSEMIDELKQAVDAMVAEPDDHKRAELQETMDLLAGNLARIVEHGRRADGIVKSMLAHSRGGTGDWQSSNINGLIEEALNLAYHGARAQDQNFNVTLERAFDQTVKPIDVVPQDVTRVFLNLFGNSFYATRQRQRYNGSDAYQPTVIVSTRDLGEAVEVHVRDNGIGIAPEVRDKLFQPFFTTKPTGEGTGLGLSISYDIVTQQHGGSIEVESEVGRYTDVTVRLPRASRAGAG